MPGIEPGAFLHTKHILYHWAMASPHCNILCHFKQLAGYSSWGLLNQAYFNRISALHFVSQQPCKAALSERCQHGAVGFFEEQGAGAEHPWKQAEEQAIQIPAQPSKVFPPLNLLPTPLVLNHSFTHIWIKESALNWIKSSVHLDLDSLQLRPWGGAGDFVALGGKLRGGGRRMLGHPEDIPCPNIQALFLPQARKLYPKAFTIITHQPVNHS